VSSGLGGLVGGGVCRDWTLWEAARVGGVLAPTDAGLGQAVVSGAKGPVRIRQTLNVESGLNDGIALPVVLVFLSACSSAHPDLGGTEYWVRFAASQLTFGPLAGILVGWLGGKAVARATEAGWMNHAFQHLSALGLALLAFAGAELLHGNGFIAAFVAGMVLGKTVSESVCECLYDFAEAEGQLLALLVFLTFGAFLLPHEVQHVQWQYVVYGLLSLTIVRMLPTALSLVGAGLKWPTLAFLGWFGPRGIASILFGLLVIDASGLAHQDEIFATVLVTVLLSVVLHGVTANVGAGWYSRHAEAIDRDDPVHQEVPEMRPRIRHSES